MQEQDVITVEGLRKTYGAVKAVDGVTFQVRRSEIFGMVGPNGSGKTTTIECIEGLRKPDEGSLRVLGLDPQVDYYALRERTGVQLQSSNLPPRMRVEEALDLFSVFYRHSTDYRPLLKELGLEEKRRTFFSQLSGGQKQRLFVALALINRPEVVFLDELTTGLDPQGRRAAWDLVREIRAGGATVVLTTHCMDEAERLCDRVAIVDRGRIVALDAPAALVRRLGDEARIVFEADGDLNAATLGVLDGVRRVARDGERVIVYGGSLAAVVNTLDAGGVRFRNLRTEGPNLEDVFLALTAGGAPRGQGSDRQEPGRDVPEQRRRAQ
jgi:ABC-2 type transport system ATP-binding protein